MKRAFVLVLLSLLLPLASSQPASASGKTYTIHNKLEWPIIVTFSTQGCKPYTFSHTIGAKTTGTMTAACGTAQIDVVPIGKDGKPVPHHHCWSNVKYYIGFNFNIMPASGVQGYCTVNAVPYGM